MLSSQDFIGSFSQWVVMHCLYNYKIKNAVLVSQLCAWIKMRRNDEYKKSDNKSGGLDRQLMAPSEIVICCSLSGGDGSARQSSRDCVKGFMSLRGGQSKIERCGSWPGETE